MECLLWLDGFECKHRCRHALMLIFVRMCHFIVPRAVCFLTPRGIQDMKQDTAKQVFNMIFVFYCGVFIRKHSAKECGRESGR